MTLHISYVINLYFAIYKSDFSYTTVIFYNNLYTYRYIYKYIYIYLNNTQNVYKMGVNFSSCLSCDV